MSNPCVMGQGAVVVSEAITLRVRSLAARVGIRTAKKLLGVSDDTFAAARDQGRMRVATRDKVIAALDRIDAEAANGEAAE